MMFPLRPTDLPSYNSSLKRQLLIEVVELKSAYASLLSSQPSESIIFNIGVGADDVRGADPTEHSSCGRLIVKACP